MFDEMVANIKVGVVRALLHARKTSQEAQRKQTVSATNTTLKGTAIKNLDDSQKKVQVINKEPKVGRNDPCPCGSGKKYKNCCGKNA